MITEFILLLLLLILSALYAGSEIVFVVANKMKLEVKAKRKYLFAEQSLALINNPEKYFSISLIGNNVVNVAYSSLSALILTNLFNFEPILILIVSSFTILIFGEIIPKYFFKDNADSYVSFFTIFLYLSQLLLTPFIFITDRIFKIFKNIIRISLEPEQYSYSKEEIFSLIKEGEQAGSFESESAKYLKRTIELKDIAISEVMIPRIEVAAISKDSSLDQIFQKFYETNHSRLVVYDGTIDNVIGIIYVKDLYKGVSDVNSLFKEVTYIPETKSCTELLHQFIVTSNSIAVVVDEFGGTAGIVSVEDILEEIIGELEEPDEIDSRYQKRIDDRTFLLSGRSEIDSINETFNLNIPSGNYITLNGYIYEKFGRIPKVGESLKIDNYLITILKASRTKVVRVKLMIQ